MSIVDRIAAALIAGKGAPSAQGERLAAMRLAKDCHIGYLGPRAAPWDSVLVTPRRRLSIPDALAVLDLLARQFAEHPFRPRSLCVLSDSDAIEASVIVEGDAVAYPATGRAEDFRRQVRLCRVVDFAPVYSPLPESFSTDA